MIYIVEGDNDFAISQFLIQLKTDDTDVLDIDLEQTTPIDDIANLDLFSSKKLFVLRNSHKNKPFVEYCVQNYDKLTADNDIVFVSEKFDKRSKLAKLVKADKRLLTFLTPKNYDQKTAIDFLITQAKKYNLKLSTLVAKQIWQLIGSNQWMQFKAIEKLAIVAEDEITEEIVNKYLDPALEIDIFGVVDKIFAGNFDQISQEIDKLEAVHFVPQIFFSMISSQIINLAMLKNNVSNGIHPYVKQKLTPLVRRISLVNLKQMLTLLVETDLKLKSIIKTDEQAWTLIKAFLQKMMLCF